MIKPKECPKGVGGGRTRVLTPLHLPLSFRGHCSQQFLFQNPGGEGARFASPLGLLHVARRGHPQGSTRAEEGRGRLERSSPSLTLFSFPGLVYPAPSSSRSRFSWRPTSGFLLCLYVHPQMDDWMRFVFWRMPK